MLQRSFRDRTVRSEGTELCGNVSVNWTILSSVARIATPGDVVFLVCIPTFSYERELIFGLPLKRTKKIEKPEKLLVGPKVDVRLRQTKSRTQLSRLNDNDDSNDIEDDLADRRHLRGRGISGQRDRDPTFVSMETVYYALERY